MFYTDEIVQMRDKFWQDKLTKLTTDVMIKQYVSTYLDLLSHDDPVLPLDALGRLDSLDNFLGQKISRLCDDVPDGLINEIAILMDLPHREDETLFDMRSLSNRTSVIDYLRLKATEFQRGLFLDYDIAGSIVEIACYNDAITEEDDIISRIWDIATELDVPNFSVATRKERIKALISLTDLLTVE